MIKPINKSILVEKIEEEKNTFVVETNRVKGKVLAVASNCESEVKVNDIVIYDDNMSQELDGLFILKETAVIAITD